MAIRSSFFNSVNGDRRYLAYNFAEYFASFIGNGVFANPSNTFQVYEKENMIVNVKAGKAWINGYIAVNDGDYNLTITNADGVLNRIDRIVLRLDFNVRAINIAVKKGAFASTPVAPTLQRDAEVYELVLADVYVGKGITKITQSNITDQRMNKALCGVVKGTVDQIDTTDLFNQYGSAFQEWFETVKNYLNDTAVGNVANKLIEHEKKPMHIHWLGKTVGLNNMVVTYSEIYSYSDGLAVSFVVNQNTNNAATLNINNLGAVPIIDATGEIQIDLRANGVYTARYLNGNFILQGSSKIPNAAQVTNLTATSGFSTVGQIRLDWINPDDRNLKGVRIVYKTNNFPMSPYDGTVFYDSNDAVPLSTHTKTGFLDGVEYFFCAYSWTYKNATRVYTTNVEPSKAKVIPYQPKGILKFTTSTMWTVPYGVSSIDVFLVGGGGGGGSSTGIYYGGSGGGGGYVKTLKSYTVTPKSELSILIGAGGNGGTVGKAGGNGGFTSFDKETVNGGNGGDISGGNGGSGGGGRGINTSNGGNGGSDGSDGLVSGGIGSRSTTKEFSSLNGTLYAAGGGGGCGVSSANGSGGVGGGGSGGTYQSSGLSGSLGTGSGGGGGGATGSSNNYSSGGNGGSGIVIVRWGY